MIMLNFRSSVVEHTVDIGQGSVDVVRGASQVVNRSEVSHRAVH